MGYMRHHLLVVTTYSDDRIVSAHLTAEVMCPSLPVSDVTTSPTNGYRSFVVWPDGSKEGWAESDNGDDERRAFIAWLNRQRFSDGSTPFSWALVQYGDEDGDNRVLDHDDNVAIGDDYSGPHELT